MWKIKHIFDGEYGCEERRKEEGPKVSVTLMNEKNEAKIVSIEDQWLIDNHLNEGDVWPNDYSSLCRHLPAKQK